MFESMIDEDKLKFVREIKKISLKENDILVIRLTEDVSMKDIDICMETVDDILKELNLNNKAIFMPHYHEVYHIDAMIKKLKKLKELNKGKDDRNTTT